MTTKNKSNLHRLILNVFSLIILGAATFLAQTTSVSAVPPGFCYSRLNGNGALSQVTCPSGITPTGEQCILITQLPGGNNSYRAHNLNCISEAQETQISTVVTTPNSSNPGAVSTDDSVEASTDFDVDCEVDGAVTEDNCQIVAYLVNGINILSAVAGMSIIASIMIAGYQYMTARDNSGAVEAAKKRIIWAMIALAMFLFMYAFLNFVIPGGVL